MYLLIKSDKNYDSPVLSIEEDSNHNSLPLSPTPPTLSPQGMSGVRSAAASPEIKCSLSDSQSVKEMDIDDIIDPLIPDATHWTSDDVYNYFFQYFPDEAKVFKEQVRSFVEVTN